MRIVTISVNPDDSEIVVMIELIDKAGAHHGATLNIRLQSIMPTGATLCRASENFNWIAVVVAPGDRIITQQTLADITLSLAFDTTPRWRN